MNNERGEGPERPPVSDNPEVAELLEGRIFPALKNLGYAEELSTTLDKIYSYTVSTRLGDSGEASRLANWFYRDFRQAVGADESAQILQGEAGVNIEDVADSKQYVMRIRFKGQKETHKKYGLGILTTSVDEEGNKRRSLIEIQLLRATGDAIDDPDEPFEIVPYHPKLSLAVRQREISKSQELNLKKTDQLLKPGVKLTLGLGFVAIIGTAISVVAAKKLHK